MSDARTKRLNESKNPVRNSGIADNEHKLIIPQNTSANLAQISHDVGSIAYDTTLNQLVVDGGSGFAPAGASLPDQSGHVGEFLQTDGSVLSWAAAGGGGANQELSNLDAGGTALNQNLTFAIPDGRILSPDSAVADTGTLRMLTGAATGFNSGQLVHRTGDSDIQTGSIQIRVGNALGTDTSGGGISIQAGDSTGTGTSATAVLKGGSSVDGAAGGVLIQAGVATGSGANGDIRLRVNSNQWVWPDTIGAAGSVLTDVAGDGILSFAAGGGGGLSNPLANNAALQWLDNTSTPVNLVQMDSNNHAFFSNGLTNFIDISASSIKVFPVNGAGGFIIQAAHTNLLPSGGDGQPLVFADGGNNFAVSIKAPAALTQDSTLTLPDGVGTAGQVLQTDGTGITSWTNAGGAPTVNQGAEVFPADTAWSGQVTFTSSNATYDQNTFTVTANQFTAKRTGLHQVTVSGAVNISSITDSYRVYAMINATTAVSNNEIMVQCTEGTGTGSTGAFFDSCTRMYNLTAGDFIAFEAHATNAATFTNLRIQFTEIGVS